jgi:glutathione S-transferase
LAYLASKHDAYGGQSQDERLEVLRWLWLRGRLNNAFTIVDKHLAARPFMVGEEPTIADISLCGYLFYPVAESGYEIAGRFCNIEAWLERMRALPGWADPYDIRSS